MMFKFLVLFAFCSNVFVWASPISSEAGVAHSEHQRKLYECNAEGNLVEKTMDEIKAVNDEQDNSNVNDEKLEQNDEDDEAVDGDNEDVAGVDEATNKKVNKLKRILKEFHQRVKNAVHDLVQRKHKKIVEIIDSLKEKARKFWKKTTGSNEADTIAQELMSFQ